MKSQAHYDLFTKLILYVVNSKMQFGKRNTNLIDSINSDMTRPKFENSVEVEKLSNSLRLSDNYTKKMVTI